MIGTIVAAGLMGMESSINSAVGDTAKVAQFDRPGGDLIGGMVGLKQDAMQFKASAAVVKVDDAMQKSLLDILA